MASELVADEPQENAGGLAGVGARLSAARRKQEIELEAVATELHLRVEVLRALEAGDEAGLPSPAFTRGYVRSYARLVGLDGDELLSQLPERHEQQLKPVGRAAGPRRRPRPQLGKLLLWLLVLGGLALAVLYGVPLVERLLDRTAVEPDPGQLALPPAEEAPAAPGQGLAIPPPSPAVRKPPEEVPLVSTDSPAQVPASEPVPVPAPVAEKEAVPAVSAAPESEKEQTAPSVLVLRFTRDSWVEIDAGGRKLLTGIQPAGSERRLEVTPPVDVLLGNAPGVELVYGGEVMDTRPYRKGKVARIRLKEATHE